MRNNMPTAKEMTDALIYVSNKAALRFREDDCYHPSEAVELIHESTVLKGYEVKHDGLFVTLPCRIGCVLFEATNRDTVNVHKLIGYKIVSDDSIYLCLKLVEGFLTGSLNVPLREFGKRIFILRDEAEAKAKELFYEKYKG